MLLDTINRKLAEQYERETHARTSIRLVHTTRKTPEKSAMARNSSMPRTCKPATPPPPLHALQDEVRLPAPALVPAIAQPASEPEELPETEPAEPEAKVAKGAKGTVKPGCVTVGVPLPKDMHAIFKARALAKGTSIKHEVLLSIGRDLR